MESAGRALQLGLEPATASCALAEVAADVARYNFQWRFVTLVLCAGSSPLGVGAFLRAYRNTVVLARDPTGSPAPARQVVIYGDSWEDLVGLLRLLAKSRYDSTGWYLFVCGEPACDEAAAMNICWAMNIVNVVFIKTRNLNGDTASFTYSPFTDNECRDRRPIELNLRKGCLTGLYPDKFRNLRRCQIVASTFHQPPFMIMSNSSGVSGAEGDLLRMLAELLNATVAVVAPAPGPAYGWGYLERGDWTGSLGDVYHNRANLCIASAAITLARYTYFDVSFPYNSLDVVWVTAPSALKPGWEKLMYPYRFTVRVILVAMFIAIAAFSSLTHTRIWKKWRNLLKIDRFDSNLLFLSCVIFLGLPATRLPTKSIFSAVLLMWIIFTFVVRTGYQAALISSLKTKAYERGYTTFEAAAKDMPFGGPASIKEYYQEESWVLEGWKDVAGADFYPLMEKLSKRDLEFVFGINKVIALEFLRYHNGTRKLQIIPEKIVNIPAVIFLNKNSHLTEPLSRLLSRLTEAGLWRRLLRKYLPSERSLRAAAAAPDAPQRLNLAHFTGCWVIIMFGWLLASIFFVIEVLCGRADLKCSGNYSRP